VAQTENGKVVVSTAFACGDESAMYETVRQIGEMRVRFEHQCLAWVQFSENGEMMHFLLSLPRPDMYVCDWETLRVRIEPCGDLPALKAWRDAHAPMMQIMPYQDCTLVFDDEDTADAFDKACVANQHRFRGPMPRLDRLP
jgi:hypothetical protein